MVPLIFSLWAFVSVSISFTVIEQKLPLLHIVAGVHVGIQEM